MKDVEELLAGEDQKSDGRQELSASERQRKARAKAMRLLEHMDRTEKGLAQRLRQAEFSEAETADAMQYVKSFGYLDDMRYAQVYIRGRIHAKSRKQIFQELMKKGVDRETIRMAWEAETEFEQSDERALIRTELLKKYGTGAELDEREMRRLQGFFARRGFQYEDVSAVMSELEIHVSYEREPH